MELLPHSSFHRSSTFVPYDKLVVKRTLSKHRHAAPSAPWPWIDLGDEIDPEVQAAVPKFRHECPHEKNRCEGCWKGYPQSHYPNWTPPQVWRCGISRVDPDPVGGCGIHYIDVDETGHFSIPGIKHFNQGDHEMFWKVIQSAVRIHNTTQDLMVID